MEKGKAPTDSEVVGVPKQVLKDDFKLHFESRVTGTLGKVDSFDFGNKKELSRGEVSSLKVRDAENGRCGLGFLGHGVARSGRTISLRHDKRQTRREGHLEK